MAESREGSVDEQAAAWLARLQNRSVSTAELDEFARWRRKPGHAAAYERAEAMWNQSATLSADPDIRRALHGSLRGSDPGPGRYISHPLLMVTAMAGAVVLAIGTMAFLTSPASHFYQTAVGERSSVRLSDGSDVQLDTDSKVATSFDDAERRVTLATGQAFFQVAHAADRPFIVDAGDGITVTATGTRFDVRRTPERVLVALVSGSVVVQRHDAELARMKPGSIVEVATGNGLIATSTTMAEATGWRDGHVSFRETPLIDAVEEMNRYTTTKLEVRIADARSQPVSGEFSTDDPAGFVRAVNALLGEDAVGR